LSFAREPVAVPTEGRVVWTAPVLSTPGRRCGLAWELAPGQDADRLLEMIGASA